MESHRTASRHRFDAQNARLQVLDLGSGHGRPAKRPKIAHACVPCRSRKSRCDGAQPVCGECAQRPTQAEPCRYKATATSEREEINRLRQRIRELEHRPPPPLHLDAAAAGSGQLFNLGRSSPTAPHNASTSAQGTPLPPHPIDPPIQDGPVDAMGATSAVELDDGERDDRDDRYYGSSSAVSFVHQVYETILHGNPLIGTTAGGPMAVRSTQVAGGRFWALKPMDRFSLLPRPLMDRMLTCYWERVHHLYPFVHKPTVMRAYEHLWQADPTPADLDAPGAGVGGSVEYGPNSVVFHCALNMMLAIATQFMDTPIDERRRLAALFEDRARSLCQLEFFDDGSIAVIQALLLTTQYFQSTPYPNRCWNYLGISCRLAQSLGLYIERPHTVTRLSPLDVEMRRRVWWGCVTLDAVVSMTLGRPLMLHHHQPIALPAPVDDDYLHGPDRQPADHVSYLHFFIQTIQLYQLLADVVSQIYPTAATAAAATTTTTNAAAAPSSRAAGTVAVNPAHPELRSFAFILDMDATLAGFEHRIPPHLHWDRRETLPAALNSVNVFAQQSSVLRVRFLHLQILLYRPAFVRYCQQVCAPDAASARSPAAHFYDTAVALSVAHRLSVACVDASMRLIEQVYLRATTDATGAWWYNLFYARTSGIVVLLAMACDPITQASGWTNICDAWHKCKAALSALQVFSATVARCLRGLERLHQHVLTYRFGTLDPDPSQPPDHRHSLLPASSQPPLVSAVGPGDGHAKPGGESNAADLFSHDMEFGWPSELETSMLDDIFAFDAFD